MVDYDKEASDRYLASVRKPKTKPHRSQRSQSYRYVPYEVPTQPGAGWEVLGYVAIGVVIVIIAIGVFGIRFS